MATPLVIIVLNIVLSTVSTTISPIPPKSLREARLYGASLLSPFALSHAVAFANWFRGRERSESRSPVRDRKRRRSRSLSTPPRRETPEKKARDSGAASGKRGREKTENESDGDKDGVAKKAPLSKAKKTKGSKLFKQSKKDDGGGNERDSKAATGSVEYWNEERAKLGLKPLK